MSDSMSYESPMRVSQPAVPSRSYVAAWVVCAALAVAYVSVMAARPEFLAGYLPEGHGEAGNVDVGTMRATIRQLNAELAEAKTAAATSAAQVGVLTGRMAELEAKLAAAPASAAQPAATVAAAPVEAPASALARKFAEARSNTEPAKPTAEPAKPVAAVKLNAPAAPAPAQVAASAPTAAAAEDAARISGATIETGSIAVPRAAVVASAQAPAVAAPVAFGPAVVTPAAQPFGLQIGRGGSVDELRLSWSLLQEQHAASLKNLGAHYAAASDAADAPLNLVAGPMKSKAEAIKVCKTLSAQGVACKVGAFAGEPL